MLSKTNKLATTARRFGSHLRFPTGGWREDPADEDGDEKWGWLGRGGWQARAECLPHRNRLGNGPIEALFPPVHVRGSMLKWEALNSQTNTTDAPHDDRI